MKKGLCILLSAVILAFSFTACSKKGGDSDEVTTKTNADGSAYVEVTYKNGKAIVDSDGNAVTSVLSEDEISKIENKDSGTTAKGDKTEKTSKTKKGETTTLEVNSKVVEAVTDDTFDMTAAEKDLIQEGTTIKKTTLFEDKVQKVIKTGVFTIDMSVVSSGTEMPMKLVFDKDKMYATFNMNGMEAGILYKDNTAYILFPNLFVGSKVYMEYPDAGESMDEVFKSFSSISENGGKYVGSTKVKVDKKEYTCEEYKGEDGTVFKYYFDGKTWARYECINEEGSMIYKINSFSGKADSSVFNLKGYRKIDESALSGLLGGTSSSTKKASK